jgi:hypothetical protein
MLKKKHINIIGYKVALLFFIFMFSGIAQLKASSYCKLYSQLSVKHLSSHSLQQEQNQEELRSFQYTNSSRDLSDLFDKTDSTTVRQVDPDKVQLKNLLTIKDDYQITDKSYQTFNSSFKPQLTQSVSLFIFHRNILI